MKIRFYYASGANCCERVRWALDYKCVPYELVDLDQPFDEAHFHRISPFGRVPLMEVDAVPLTESMAMLEFLEEIAPRPALNYRHVFLRAQVREVCEAVNASIHPIQNSSIVKRFQPSWSKQEMRPFRATWIGDNLAKLAPLLWRQSQFAVGTEFSLADILVAVMFRKGIALGMEQGALAGFAAHWAALMAVEEIRRACPLPEAREYDGGAGST